MSMQDLTNHIIAVANDNKKTITNLQLQKILYFVLRNSVPFIGKKLAEKTYDEKFLVWKYGPVLKTQYDRFNSYGSSPILEDFQQLEVFQSLNAYILKLLDLDVFKMVNASHTHKFWKENQDKILFGRSNIEYPLEEVLRGCDEQ